MSNKYSEETHKLIINILLSVCIKGGALLISLMSTPLYIRFFNDDITLGLWFTLYSLLSWILNFDLGIGNGLRNQLAISLSKKDKKKSGELIYSAYIVTFIFCAIVFLIYLCLGNVVEWKAILNISDSYKDFKSISKTINIVVVSILLQMFLRTINFIYYAEQLPNVNNITAIISSMIVLFFLVLSNINSNNKSIVTVAYVNLVAVNLPLLVVTIGYFFKNKYLLLHRFKIEKNTVNSILDLGLKFFYIQIVYMIIASTNEFFINYYGNSASVVEYSIYNKLFTIVGLAMGVLTTPVWSAITKAQTEKRNRWVIKLFNILVLVGLASVVFNAIIAFFSQKIFDLWLGRDSITVNSSCVWIFMLYGSTISITGILTSFANGMGEVRVQAIMYTVIAVIKIISAKQLTTHLGWLGIILVSMLGMLFFVVIQYIDIAKRLKKASQEDK